MKITQFQYPSIVPSIVLTFMFGAILRGISIVTTHVWETGEIAPPVFWKFFFSGVTPQMISILLEILLFCIAGEKVITISQLVQNSQVVSESNTISESEARFPFSLRDHLIQKLNTILTHQSRFVSFLCQSCSLVTLQLRISSWRNEHAKRRW